MQSASTSLSVIICNLPLSLIVLFTIKLKIAMEIILLIYLNFPFLVKYLKILRVLEQKVK